MKIDWFTVIAQVINFLILVWLLKKFLYKPVLNAIAEREKKVDTQLSDAATKMVEANDKLKEYQDKNIEFDQKKKGMMDEVVKQSEEQKQNLFDKARKDAEALRLQLEKAVKEKEENLEKEIAEKTKQEVFAISRKTLKDLADKDLEDQVVNTFISKLKESSETVKQEIQSIFISGKPDLAIKSAFELSDKQEEEIKNAVKTLSEKELAFRFEIDPQLISGIELSVNGYKVGWNISEYLTSLQKNISGSLQEKVKNAISN
jgi:F-type H+-transporting ATPase subunit b